MAASLLFPNLNRGGVSGYDDALYAHEGKEMLRTGDWWTVHFNGMPNFEYPPVFIWMEALSMKAFGVNDYAAKLPSALAGFGTIVILYLLMAELTGEVWLATVAMFVLSTSQLFVKYATHAMTDVPFTFFTTLAFYLYVRGLRQRWFFLAVGIPVAIAILTRSVIGLFPLGVMTAHLLLSGRYRRLWSPEFLAMWAFAVGLPLLWFGFPPRPEHLAFLAAKVGAGPSIHLLDYGWMLLRFYWPWLPFLVVGTVIQARAGALFPLLWCVGLIGPLSLASTKYARYLLPAFPALAMLTASGVNRFVRVARRELFFGSACGVLLLVSAYTMIFPAKERGADMRMLAATADRNTDLKEQVVIYSGGEMAFDLQNQFLWYSERHSHLVNDLEGLTTGGAVTLIIDKASYAKLVNERSHVLGATDRFVCARVTPLSH